MGGGSLTGTSPSIGDARKVLQWLKAPYLHYGQLYAAIRDGHGGRRRNRKPPGWMDTDQGRLLFGVDPSGWVSLAGAGPAGHREHDAAATRNPTARALTQRGRFSS
jgi:hypothetical protein